MSLLQAALDYAARGWAVFPLAPGDKLPLIAKNDGGNGVYDATTDQDVIRQWWGKTPNANVGIAAGASGLLLVDVDQKDGRDGFTSWECIRASGDMFDDTTPHVWTPNNGKHLYFSADGAQLRNTNDELGPGIETKANGKYLVAPPSRLANGSSYRWDERLNLDTVNVAPIPDPLRRLLGPKSKPTPQPVATPVARSTDFAPSDDYEAAKRNLKRLAPWRYEEYDAWVHVGMALSELGNDGFELWNAWSQSSGKYHADEMARKFASFTPGDGYTLASLAYWASQDDPTPARAVAVSSFTPTPARAVAVSSFTPTPEPPGWMNAAPYTLDSDGAPAATGKKRESKSTEPPTLTLVSLRELLTTEWPEPVYVVKGMLPEGLTNVAGKSKIGKSWLCLQLGFAVGSGGMFLNERVEQGRVLYAALEDSYPWLADRAKKQGMRDALDAQMDFLDIESIRAVRDQALLPVIRSGKYRLCVVDTLSRALTGDQNDTGDMTAALSAYQAAALAAHCAVVFVDHHNKLGAATTGATTGIAEPDPMLNLLGATGKGAVADGIWGIYRHGNGKRGALLVITGRRVPEQRLTIVKDPVTQVWQVDQAPQERVNITPERSEILAAVAELGAASSSEVAKHTGQNRGNAHKRLQDLVNLGLLAYDGKQYKLPEVDEDGENL